jgi:hypothetical protein
LGLVEEDAEGLRVTGDVWMIATGDRKTIANLRLWRDVNGAPDTAIAQLEQSAYARDPSLGGEWTK